MRRGNDNESIFYEDEWEDEDDGDYDETPTPILPPMAPERPNMDAANSILDNSSKSEEESDEMVDNELSHNEQTIEDSEEKLASDIPKGESEENDS